MGLLLDVGYGLAALVASPFLLFKLATDARYRHRLGERFGGVPERAGGAACLWIHAASVGEVNVARPIVRELKRRRPELEMHVSTLTKAGREHAEAQFPDARVHYFPIDFSFAAARALRRVRPTAVALVELEVWPNFLRAAQRARVPVVVVNGRISHRSHRRYRRSRPLWRGTFRRVARWGMQGEAHAERLREIGVDPALVRVTGNVKYDAAIAFDPRHAREEFRSALGLDANDRLIVGGSTHDPEERILAETYLKLRAQFPSLRLLVAPRHRERLAEAERAITDAGLRVVRRSAGVPPAGAVVLLDTVGELARIYAAATLVVIGGTYGPRGGQNMLEPAALGVPVLSGPSLENFRDIADGLVAAGGMRVVDDPAKLADAAAELLADPARAAAMGGKAREAVEAGRGAISGTADLVESVL